MPAGYLGDFTCNRYALLVNENGGQLVRTTRYGIKENLQDRKINAVLGDDGTLQVKTSTRYAGLQQDGIHSLINHLSKDKVKEKLHEHLDFATYDITRFEYREEKSDHPVINEWLDITVTNYANITGKRLFIVPNVMTRTNRKPADDPDRKFDIVLGEPYLDVDTVTITLPTGYSAESLPADVSVNSRFGKYSCSVKLTGNQLLYYRSIEYPGGRFPAQDFPDLVKYFATIYKADRNRVVLVKDSE